MINSNLILEIVERGIAGSSIFLVDILVKPTGLVQVFIDSDTGVSVEDCAKLSRYIHSNLEGKENDFELQVSSPGLTSPFKVMQQYRKNIGREIEIVLTDGSKQKARLEQVNDDNIEIAYNSKVNNKNNSGADKSQVITKKIIDLKEVKSTKTILSFK